MTAFVMHVESATQYERIDGVVSFVGEDASGSFGIRARHARMMTVLSYGLARYQLQDGEWKYLAFPGGALYFSGQELHVSARRYLHDADYARISAALLEQLLQEEEQLRAIKESLYRLEQEMFRRLWQMGRSRV
jgi:F-type H+-transporting ATPase subunit epsilon